MVTCFVERDRRVLVLKRSEKVGTYRGCWSGVSGYLETPDPIEQAWIELREELGATADDLTLERIGSPLVILDETSGRRWRVHPFRFLARPSFEPRLDWENLEARWVSPKALSSMTTVPELPKTWAQVAG